MYDNEFKTWSCDNFIAVPCCPWLYMQLHARMTVAGHF